jgi:lipopolysaccharide export LptBFGC system permease protein LptF
VKQSRQMNFHELGAYIRGAAERLRYSRTQVNCKIRRPLFALIMAMVSIPFAFLAKPRDMAGSRVSLGIAIVYWSVGQVFGQFESKPVAGADCRVVLDAIFSSLVCMARMRT